MGSVGGPLWTFSPQNHQRTSQSNVHYSNFVHFYHGYIITLCAALLPRVLLEHDKVVTTPHLGASTTEAQLKVAQEIAQQFVDAVQGKGLNGVVSRVCVCVYSNFLAESESFSLGSG